MQTETLLSRSEQLNAYSVEVVDGEAWAVFENRRLASAFAEQFPHYFEDCCFKTEFFGMPAYYLGYLH